MQSRKIIGWWIHVKAGMNIESHNMIYLSIYFTEIHLRIDISLQWSWYYFLHLSTISLSRTSLGNRYKWGNPLVGYLGCWLSMMLEHAQKVCLRVILDKDYESYSSALERWSLSTLFQCCQDRIDTFYGRAIKHTVHKNLLPLSEKFRSN